VLIAGSEPGNPKDVRLAAMNAIGDLDDKRAVPILRKYFADQDPEIRQEAEFEAEYISAPSAHSNTLPKTMGK
jgi:HEAT repeat protein